MWSLAHSDGLMGCWTLPRHVWQNSCCKLKKMQYYMYVTYLSLQTEGISNTLTLESIDPSTSSQNPSQHSDTDGDSKLLKSSETAKDVAPSGQDEPDRASVYSFFMERDFRYYFQHPYLRLIIAYLVTFCNFLIYAEDPVAHSQKECFIPIVGNCFAFVVTYYPPNAWSLLKVILWIAAIAVGMVVGKLVVHSILFSKFIYLSFLLANCDCVFDFINSST